MTWIVAAVFLGIVALIVGAYFLFVVRDEQQMLDRLAPKGQKTRALKGVLKPEERMSSVAPIQSILERTGPLSTPLNTLLAQSGLQLNLATFLLLSMVAALGAYLLATAFTGLLLLGALAGVVAGFLPLMYVRRARDKRMIKFEEQFPEAIDLVARALRAGHALPTGLGMVAEEMPPPVGTEFRILFDEQNFGLTLGDAMRNFGARIPVLDARFFVTAVLTQRESGGNLAEVLDNLSSVIRERFKVKRQVRVISAHGRITGWILAGLPPSLALATLILNPAHLGTLLDDPIGIRMIVTAVFLQVAGTLAIRRIVNIEY
jgi:tight adherence protein B